MRSTAQSPQRASVIPEKVAVEQGRDDAYAAEGYVTDDGAARDPVKLRQHILGILVQHKVLSKAEKTTKAITHGDLVAQVFPSLPGPDEFSDQADPQLAHAIWKKIASEVWGMTNPSAVSPLQRLVGNEMGNGYIMCRTTIGKNEIDAVYVTDNVACIDQDFVIPDNLSLQQKTRNVARNREMLILRQPENAAKYAKRFDETMKAISSEAHSQLKLAAESATLGDADGDDSDES